MTHPQRQTALVTGASSGIGKAIAKSLLHENLTVVVAARNTNKMADLKALGADPIHIDMADNESIEQAVSVLLSTYGRIDILVNNAGFGCYGTVEETAIADARYQFEVNLFGLARLTQLLLPNMRENRAGKIINISSMGGKIYTPLGAWYHASKHALEGWSDCLRLELSPFGIDVIIIEPGIIATRFGDVLMEPMLQRSGRGAYAELANKMASATQSSYESGGGSSPDVVAEAVTKAVKARRPKTRYVVGKFARPLMVLRKWFSDRVFDWTIMQTIR